MSDIKGGQIVYDVIIRQVSGNNDAINSAESSLKKLGNTASKTADEVDKASQKTGGSFSRIKDIVAGLGIFEVFKQGLTYVKDFFVASVNGALESQLAEAKLRTALQNVTSARQGDADMLIEQASALQKVTTFTDEQILQADQLLATFQLNGEAISQLNPRLLDMATSLASVGETTMDLDSLAIALGKSLTLGADSLTRYGVTLTDAQAKQFDMAKGMDKVKLLTEILDQNFKGLAEAAGKTMAGRIQIAKNAFGDFQETIGNAVMPAINTLFDDFGSLTGGMGMNAETTQMVTKVAYGLAKTLSVLFGILKIGVNGIKQSIITLKNFGDVIYKVAEPVVNLIKGIGGAITSLADGDVKGAVSSIGGAFEKTFDSIKSGNYFKNIATEVKQSATDMKESFTEIGKSNLQTLSGIVKDTGEIFTQADLANKIIEAKKGAEAQEKIKKINDGLKDMAGSTKEAGKASKEAQNELEGFQKKLLDVRENAIKTAQELRDNLAKAFKEFSGKITDSVAETSDKLAEIYVNAEEKKKQLQEQIAKGGDVTQAQKELADVQKTLDARVGYEERSAKQIEEIKKRVKDAGLDPNALNLDGLKSQQTLEQEIANKRIESTLGEFALFEKKQNEKLLKLTNDFITETLILKNKIDKQQEFEAELTTFLESENIKRKKSIEAFASASILKYGQMANALRDVISLQNQLGSVSSGSQLPQFHDGGYVGASGGEVHPGEFVVPANVVAQMPELVSALDKARTQNNSITINGANTNSGDLKTITEEMLWKLGRM